MSSSASNSVNGIDVSHYQGTVNWPAVKSGGNLFAFAKATEGTNIVDSEFATNWQGMQAAGVLRGAYHFYDSSQDPQAQAQNFLKTVGSLSATDLPPVLDIESSDGAYGNNTLSANIQIWLNTVQAGLGHLPIIYTGTSFWNADMTNQFGGYPLWIAQYGVSTPTLPNGWTSWTFWQSSESGTASGVSGAVDIDCFAGSYADLQTFIQKCTTTAGSPSAPATPAPSTSQTYTVKPGDTLTSIAAQFGVTVNQLAAANNIQNTNVITVGEVLVIPS